MVNNKQFQMILDKKWDYMDCHTLKAEDGSVITVTNGSGGSFTSPKGFAYYLDFEQAEIIRRHITNLEFKILRLNKNDENTTDTILGGLR